VAEARRGARVGLGLFGQRSWSDRLVCFVVADQIADQRGGLSAVAPGVIAPVPAHAREAQQREKHHHAHAVVKQALAGELGLDALRGTDLLHDRQHRDGVGGGDQRAKQHGVHQRQVQAQGLHERPGAQPHQHGGDHHAHGGETQNQPGLLAQVRQLHVQRPGKEQKAQQPVHQRVVEVDRADNLAGEVVQPGIQARPQREARGKHQGQQHQADRGRQLGDAERGRRRVYR